MDKYFIILLVIIICIPFAILFRFIDLGIRVVDAVYLTLRFPFIVFRLHLALYRKISRQDKKLALKIFFLPLTDLPRVIVSVGEMYIEGEARLLAIKEVLQESSKKDQAKIINALKKKGILVERKKIQEIKQAHIVKIVHKKISLKNIKIKNTILTVNRIIKSLNYIFGIIFVMKTENTNNISSLSDYERILT